MKAIKRTIIFAFAGAVLGVIGSRTKAPPSANGTAPPAAVSATIEGRRAGVPDRRPAQHDDHFRQRDIAPTDRRYDPLTLVREQPELSLKEIFESEPRDLAFAPVMEKRIYSALDTIVQELELQDRVLGVRTECKTLSCYTVVEVASADLDQVYDEINSILLGDSQVPSMIRNAGRDDLAAVTFYNIYRPETRDDAYYDKIFLHEAMRFPLELAKKKYLKNRPEPE